jgi:hypothetical protein
MISLSLKDYAVEKGIGTFGADLFVRQMPDTPDNCVCIFDESGVITPEMHSYDADSFGTHWLVRGSYSWASAKVLEIHRKVTNMSGVYAGISILVTFIQNEPMFVENDDKGRAVFSIHYTHDCSIGNNANRQSIREFGIFDETFDGTFG